MSISPNIKKILIISLGLLVLGFLGYYFLIKGSTDVSSLITPSQNQTVGQDILVLVDKLKKISIDSSFLSSVLLNNLKDFSIPISSELQGRANPFALVGLEGVVGQESSTAKKKP